MKPSFLNFFATLLTGSLLIFQTGCKEDTIIKANASPTVDGINVIQVNPDSITILAKTIIDDSVVTSYTRSGYQIIHGLGTLNDPFFGRTNMGIYMQVLPPAANYDFINPPDSAFIILPYNTFVWGDTGVSQESFTAYRVTDTMTKDAVYYSFASKTYDPTPITLPATVDFVASRFDSVKIAGINRAPHMRLKLTSSFLSELTGIAKTSADNASFLSAMKGIYIQASDTNNNSIKALPYFNIDGSSDYSRASIVFYFHNTTPGIDTTQFAFFSFVSTDCAHFNRISRRRQGYPIEQYLNSTLASDSIVFLQNEPGATIDLKFPNLKNLPHSVINKAELSITALSLGADPWNSKTALLPAKVFPVGVHSDGSLYGLADIFPLDQPEPSGFMDGNAHTINLSGGVSVTRYIINMQREVQKAIVNQADTLHLHINGTQTYFAAYRLTAGGKNDNPIYKIAMNITYSKIK